MAQAAPDASAAETLAALIRTKRLGITLMVMSAGLLTVGDATAKWLSTTYPIGEIIFIRGAIIVMLLVALRLPHRLAGLMPRHLMKQFCRALFFVLATFLMIWSLSLLPLATVSAISFAAPIITTALAPWMLGEVVGWRRWIAVLVGFLGVLLIVAPFGGDWTWALLIPLGAAAAQSLRDIVTRQLVGTETNESVVFVTMGATVLAGALSAPFGWINPQAWGWLAPSAWDFALFMFYGVATCAAYLMQVGALRAAEAAFLAPFKYSLMLWAILIGFAVWGHIPGVAVLAGSGIIICSGIFIWSREVSIRGKHG